MPIEYSEPEAPTVGLEEESETASIPVSILAGKTVSPGDVVRLEVVSVDEDGGNVQVKYATQSEKPMGGIMGAAGKFEA